MLDRIIRELSSPAGWVADFVKYGIFRMLEVNNVVGIGKLIQSTGGATSNG
jgi:hypothetical protein